MHWTWQLMSPNHYHQLCLTLNNTQLFGSLQSLVDWLVNWTGGLGWWTGLVDWTGGLDWWTGGLDWWTELNTILKVKLTCVGLHFKTQPLPSTNWSKNIYKMHA